MLKNNKGVTLIELLVVIVILGIIATLGVTLVGSTVESSRQDAFITDVRTVESATALYCTSASNADYALYCEPDSTNYLPRTELELYLSLDNSYDFVVDARGHETKEYSIIVANNRYYYNGLIQSISKGLLTDVPDPLTLPTLFDE